jgi:hypothetical protein
MLASMVLESVACTRTGGLSVQADAWLLSAALAQHNPSHQRVAAQKQLCSATLGRRQGLGDMAVTLHKHA